MLRITKQDWNKAIIVNICATIIIILIAFTQFYIETNDGTIIINGILGKLVFYAAAMWTIGLCYSTRITWKHIVIMVALAIGFQFLTMLLINTYAYMINFVFYLDMFLLFGTTFTYITFLTLLEVLAIMVIHSSMVPKNRLLHLSSWRMRRKAILPIICLTAIRTLIFLAFTVVSVSDSSYANTENPGFFILNSVGSYMCTMLIGMCLIWYWLKSSYNTSALSETIRYRYVAQLSEVKKAYRCYFYQSRKAFILYAAMITTISIGIAAMLSVGYGYYGFVYFDRIWFFLMIYLLIVPIIIAVVFIAFYFTGIDRVVRLYRPVLNHQLEINIENTKLSINDDAGIMKIEYPIEMIQGIYESVDLYVLLINGILFYLPKNNVPATDSLRRWIGSNKILGWK